MCRFGSCLLGVLAVCLMQASVQAASADEKRGELKGLRDQIHGLQQDISSNEVIKNAAADRLARSEQAISDAQRKLRDITRDKAKAEADIAHLQAERQKIESDIKQLRQQLGDALYRTYVEGGQAGTRQLLSGEDPNQLSRDTYYLEQIAHQRALTIDEARLSLQNLQQVMDQAEQHRQQIIQLELDAKKEQSSIERERSDRQSVLAEIASKLNEQRKQMVSLQHDQGRLQKLIDGLERIAAQQEAARKKKAEEAAAKAIAAVKTPKTPDVPREVNANKPVEPVTEEAALVAPPGSQDAAFALLKGRLHWPVKGELSGRFGAPRAGGGAIWRGVFIRAEQGTEVRAVASGTIAFADWLRGFGNLLIIDHGDGYMTIYGNNDSLYKSAGEHVNAGEVVAVVGASGGSEESGLYFEMRHRGEPFDPLKWVVAK